MIRGNDIIINEDQILKYDYDKIKKSLNFFDKNRRIDDIKYNLLWLNKMDDSVFNFIEDKCYKP